MQILIDIPKRHYENIKSIDSVSLGRIPYKGIVMYSINAIKNGVVQEPRKGHWKLVQRGKAIDVCCSNCGAVRIKGYAYNYTIDELNKEDINECFGSAEMRYCPNCGVDMREVEE